MQSHNQPLEFQAPFSFPIYIPKDVKPAQLEPFYKFWNKFNVLILATGTAHASQDHHHRHGHDMMSHLTSRLSGELNEKLYEFHACFSPEEQLAWNIYISSVGRDFSSQGEAALTSAVFRSKGPYLVMMAVLKLSGVINDHGYPMGMSALRVMLHAPAANDFDFPYFKSIFAAGHTLRLEALATEKGILADIRDFQSQIEQFQQSHHPDHYQPLKVHLRLRYIDHDFSESPSHDHSDLVTSFNHHPNAMHLTTYFENCLPVSDTMIPVHEVSLDYRGDTYEQEEMKTAQATFLGLKSLLQASNHLRKLEICGIEDIRESFDLSGLTAECLHRILQEGHDLHAVRIREEEKLHHCTTAQFEKLPREIKHLDLIDCKVPDDVQTFLEEKYPRIANFAHHEHSH